MRTLVTGSCLMVLFTVSGAAWADEAPKADNTAQNKGALERNAVTAEKQGNGKSQVKMLSSIRKSIMSEKDLSMDAKNVKILYGKDGSVTLRGPVDSDAERSRVEDIVKNCDGVSSIKNEITVAEKKH